MKGGSLFYWRTVVGVVGSTSPGVALRPSASAGCWESGAEWPCSVGIRRERVEAVGAAGRTTWTAVVGLADETSARGGFCGVSLGRSSRRQPFTTACPGGDALPQGGGAAPNGCVAERRSENLGACQLWKENHRGVKIIRAQHYAGVDTSGAPGRDAHDPIGQGPVASSVEPHHFDRSSVKEEAEQRRNVQETGEIPG